MKGDVYYLKRKDDGEIIAKFEQDQDFGSGDCHEVVAWSGTTHEPIEWHFVAGVAFKPDSCTHWYFNGEDYDPEVAESSDSYYHICSPFGFQDHIRNLCFIWKVMPMILAEDTPYNPYIINEQHAINNIEFIMNSYFEVPNVNRLIDMMLDGCIIEKVEVKKSE